MGNEEFINISQYDERNVRSLVVRLLNALKSFYTFKDLESMLDIPQQALWRYVNYLTVPEESTARKILKRINELKLIERILDGVVKPNEKGRIEVWRLSNNIGFLDLLGFYATTIPKVDDIDVVVAFPEDSAPLATSIAYWVRVNLCIATRRADSTFSSKYIIETYHSNVDGRVEYLALPKGCIERDDYVLLVTNILNDLSIVDAALSLVKKAQALPWGLLAITALSRDIVAKVKDYRFNVVKVLKIV